MQTHRQIIKAIDIQVYFGKSKSMSNKMLRRLRSSLNKQLYQPITIKEFAVYYKVPVEEVIVVIRSNDAAVNKATSTTQEVAAKEPLMQPPVPNPTKAPESYQFQQKTW